MSSSSSTAKLSTPDEEKSVENTYVLRTISQVSINPHHHEIEGFRNEGDGQGHSTYNAGSVPFFMTILGCSFALAGAQMVPLLYLTLGTTIAYELEADSLTIWMFTSIIVAQGTLAPFVGPLADLCGRKFIFLVGLVVSLAGAILCAATPTAAGFIGGQVLLGIGVIVQELLSIAIVVESVPTAKRSLYAALILCSIMPWSPGGLYASWIANSSWRWIGLVVALWNLLTFATIAYFYHPPPRANSLGLKRRELVRRIDVIGGLLLTAGLLCVLVGLNWGGQDYAWNSSHVLSALIIGGGMLLGFALYECFVAPYPLFPRRIVQAPRPFFCMLYVIFAAGINYMPLVALWPIETIAVFQADRSQMGIYTLPIGICILGGAILSALLLSMLRGHVTHLMTFFCVVQTIGSACLVLVDPHDIRTAWGPVVLALIGVGGVIVPNQVIITVLVPGQFLHTDDLIASVTALTVGLRAQAQVIGLSLLYTRFVHEVTQHALTTIVPVARRLGIDDRESLQRLVQGLTAMSAAAYARFLPPLAAAADVELLAEAARSCFSASFRSVYLLTIAFGLTACLASACIGDVAAYMDNHVAVVL
ncbi:hypothetical protein QTJ16_005311 [Diplocarpon rosae]|uniref:Major facilitator superfamily (MFS) profile domain-containing protein n=1 Tax=Diplocarpon rosae TaxID=946125 RepID=A0AAD9SWR2_9HELO|nr:hypothetical protein QTJ16_005311 [Diplocarpon rosae]